MTKEELREHCEKQIRACEMWAHSQGERPCGKVYEEHKLILDLINTLEQQKQRWIPISERLPEDGTWNLFTDGKKISIERYKLDAIDHFEPSGRFFSLEKTVAWQPLPERYEKERGVENE